MKSMYKNVDSDQVHDTMKQAAFSLLELNMGNTRAGSKTVDSDTLSLLKGGTSEKGNVKTAFTPEVTSLKWVQTSGTLSLVLATSSTCDLPGGAEAKRKLVNCMKAGVEYVLQFELTNGDTVQSAPAVSVTAEYESGKFFPKKDMNGPVRARVFNPLVLNPLSFPLLSLANEPVRRAFCVSNLPALLLR